MNSNEKVKGDIPFFDPTTILMNSIEKVKGHPFFDPSFVIVLVIAVQAKVSKINSTLGGFHR